MLKIAHSSWLKRAKISRFFFGLAKKIHRKAKNEIKMPKKYQMSKECAAKKMFGQSCASVHSFGFNVVAYLF